MADTYCGKTCGQCIKKRDNECVGCVTEKSDGKSEKCQIARCCKDKHHSSCYKCGNRENCVEYHLAKTPNATILARLINLLFCIMVASVIASVLTWDITLKAMPGLEVPGFALGVAISALYGVILLVLSKTNYSYQLAGMGWIVSQVLIVIGYFIGKDSIWNTVLKILSIIIILVACYSEYDAHANILYDVDNELANKWRGLWNLTISTRLAMICGLILIFMMINFGATLIILAYIGMVVVDILKFIYLHMTSKVLRKISE